MTKQEFYLGLITFAVIIIAFASVFYLGISLIEAGSNHEPEPYVPHVPQLDPNPNTFFVVNKTNTSLGIQTIFNDEGLVVSADRLQIAEAKVFQLRLQNNKDSNNTNYLCAEYTNAIDEVNIPLERVSPNSIDYKFAFRNPANCYVLPYMQSYVTEMFDMQVLESQNPARVGNATIYLTVVGR